MMSVLLMVKRVKINIAFMKILVENEVFLVSLGIFIFLCYICTRNRLLWLYALFNSVLRTLFCNSRFPICIEVIENFFFCISPVLAFSDH